MEPNSADATTVVILLCLSVILLLFHILLQGFLATRELGSTWNAGPRDEGREPQGVAVGRSNRASKNYQETYPAFVGLLLGLAFVGDPSGWGLAGAWVWFIARIVYIPLYLKGVPYIRSLVWLVSVLGLLLMMLGLIL